MSLMEGSGGGGGGGTLSSPFLPLFPPPVPCFGAGQSLDASAFPSSWATSDVLGLRSARKVVAASRTLAAPCERNPLTRPAARVKPAVSLPVPTVSPLSAPPRA